MPASNYFNTYSFNDHMFCSRYVVVKRMRLYQHSAHCPVALRLFLERNPSYWCFIPLPLTEAQQENELFSNVSRATESESAYALMTYTHHQRKLAQYMNRVPYPSVAYTFSCLQIHQQRLFFNRFLMSDVDQLPYEACDFYQIKMIAVCK